MLYTINELRQKLFQHVYDVYDIFLNFFGEEHVDLQGIPSEQEILDTLDIEETESEGIYELSYSISEQLLQDLTSNFSNPPYPYILVWWPEVKVTNENDRSVMIQDLYAQIQLTSEGNIPQESPGFLLNRSTYSITQFNEGYVHSHMITMDKETIHLRGFVPPCLGRGPIRETINSLRFNNEETLWMLFCQELALYVTVESLAGIPYRHLEYLGEKSKLLEEYNEGYSRYHYQDLELFYHSPTYDKEWFNTLLSGFMSYYCKNGHLSFGFINGKYAPGMPAYNFLIDISNTFIEWFNQRPYQDEVEILFRNKILVYAHVEGGKFYQCTSTNKYGLSMYEGRSMGFSFKGREVSLHIFEDQNEQVETTLLLSYKIAMYILHTILNIINYHYKNEQHSTVSEGGHILCAPSQTHQAACYL